MQKPNLVADLDTTPFVSHTEIKVNILKASPVIAREEVRAPPPRQVEIPAPPSQF